MTPSTRVAPAQQARALTPPPAAAPTGAVPRAGLVGGLGILLLAALAGFGGLAVVGGLVTEGDPAATARDILASEGTFRLGVASLYLVVVLDVVVAWALFHYFSPVSGSIARLAAWFRLAYAGVYLVAISQLAGVPGLLQDDGYTAALGEKQVQAQALLAVDSYHDIWLAGLRPVRRAPAPARLPGLPVRLRPAPAGRPARRRRRRVRPRHPELGAVPLPRHGLDVHVRRRVPARGLARRPQPPHPRGGRRPCALITGLPLPGPSSPRCARSSRTAYGSADVLRLDRVPVPAFGDDEVLVRVQRRGAGPRHRARDDGQALRVAPRLRDAPAEEPGAGAGCRRHRRGGRLRGHRVLPR